MMKQFIGKITIFLVLIAIADRVFGNLLALACKSGKVEFISKQCDQDILIFGSSRAEFHYNARMMEDSLGISSYNCGASGFGIINSYGYLKMVLERHKPRIIIYDVAPHFDLEKSDNFKFIRNLKPQYDNPSIRDIIHKVDPLEKWKMKSLVYRYNSCWLYNALRYFFKGNDDKLTYNHGFKPQNKFFKSNTRRVEKDNFEIDSLKVSFLEDFITSVDSSVYMVAVISPTWDGGEKEKIAYAKRIFDKHHVPLLDFSHSPKYYHHDEYFADLAHMNATGANEFTRDRFIICEAIMNNNMEAFNFLGL